MTYLPKIPMGPIRLEKGRSRLLAPVFLLSVVTTSLLAAWVHRLTRAIFNPREVSLIARQYDCAFSIDWTELTTQLGANAIPEAMNFQLIVAPRGKKEGPPDHEWPMAVMQALVAVPFFVEYYEDHYDFILSKSGRKWENAPSVWQFAHILRMAAAHGGAITLDDPSFVPVTWGQVTFGPAQNRRRIFGTDLGASDILILMLEMDEELTRLGAGPPSS